MDVLEGMHKHCNRPLVGGFLGWLLYIHCQWCRQEACQLEI